MTTGRVIAAILLSLLAGRSFRPSPIPAGPSPSKAGAQEQRQEFYHKSQGTRLIPLAWLLALTKKERPRALPGRHEYRQVPFHPRPQKAQVQ